MATLEQIRKANPALDIRSVFDEEFEDFGQVIDLPQQKSLMYLLDKTEIPAVNNVYVREVDEWLQERRAVIERDYYGEQKIEIGYCNGHSDHLNAFEFHNCSEINVAGTDLVLFLSRRSAINDMWVETDESQAFFVPKGTAIEVYATTLHFAPCAVDASVFRCLVILLAGTNSPLTDSDPNSIVFQKNKWLLTHPENQRMVDKGARIGLRGSNYKVNQITKTKNH